MHKNSRKSEQSSKPWWQMPQHFTCSGQPPLARRTCQMHRPSNHSPQIPLCRTIACKRDNKISIKLRAGVKKQNNANIPSATAKSSDLHQRVQRHHQPANSHNLSQSDPGPNFNRKCSFNPATGSGSAEVACALSLGVFLFAWRCKIDWTASLSWLQRFSENTCTHTHTRCVVSRCRQITSRQR